MTCAKTQIGLPPRARGGFSLVELMVALTIGLFLVIGLISLLVSTSQSRTELDKTSRQIENGRYALQLLTTDVQHAGFLGAYTPKTAIYSTTADPCAPLAADFAAAPSVIVPVFIFGYDGTVADPSCVTNRVAGTAILVVRRVSTTAVAAAAAGETYLQVAACAPLLPPFVVSANSADFILQKKDCATTASLNKYIVRVYYISSCNVCAPTSDDIPTLKMAEFVNGAMIVTPLVEGIQTMQVDYGIDMNSDGSPDCYISNPTSPSTPIPSQITAALCPQPATAYEWDPATRAAAIPPLAPHWANVVTVRIHVLARNNEPSADWTDTRTYNLGLASVRTDVGANIGGPFGDKYKRHVYSAVARAVNVSGRKEQP
jgi:type IV pilus assembly protein PilW